MGEWVISAAISTTNSLNYLFRGYLSLNDLVMSWLLEEEVLKGLTPELIRERGFPVQATFAYKSVEKWRKRKDFVLIIPSHSAGNFALCYAYGPRDQFVGEKRQVEIIWYRLAIDLNNFCFLQFTRVEGKIRSWLLLEHVSSIKSIQTTTSYYESEQKYNHCIKTVTISVEHDCVLCHSSPEKCRCSVKALDRYKSFPVQSTKGSSLPSPTVPTFSGSFLESLSCSSSRGYIEVAQYSMKKGSLLHYFRTDCFTNALPVQYKLAQSSFFEALESLLSKMGSYHLNLPTNAVTLEEDTNLFPTNPSLNTFGEAFDDSGLFSSSSPLQLPFSSCTSSHLEHPLSELLDDEYFLSLQSSIFSVEES